MDFSLRCWSAAFDGLAISPASWPVRRGGPARSAFFRPQLQRFVIAAEVGAEGFDDQFMVVALSQAGDGYAADDAGSFDVNGKAAAVSGKIRDGVAALFEGLAFELEAESHAV